MTYQHGPVDHVVTSGTFSLDGGTWDVDNNVWIVGDENEVIVIDAAHDVEKPDREFTDGDVLRAGAIELRVLHTPGHSPGSSCLYAPELGMVFTGDALFQGCPGATGRSFSSFDTIIASIRERLLTLPGDTTVRTGHGDSTTIDAEAPQLSGSRAGSDVDGCREMRRRANAKIPLTAEGRPVRPARGRLRHVPARRLTP